MRGLGEGFRHFLAVAKMIIERDIARRLVVDLRRVGFHRVRHGDDGGQRLNIERHGLGCILRLSGCLRDHARHRIADEAHFIDGQRKTRRLGHGGAAAPLQRNAKRHRAIAGQIGCGVDSDHAGHGARGLDIDAAQNPVRLLRAHHGAIDLAGPVDVVGILPASLQQARILHPPYGLADGEFHDRQIFVLDADIHRAIASRLRTLLLQQI